MAYFVIHMPGSGTTLRKELLLALSLLGLGLFLLPPAVYWVGRQVVGEYEGENGLWGLTLELWAAALGANPLALILITSPYLIVQALRLSRRLRRRR